MHEAALARYRSQKLILDSLSSEVHTTKRFYDVLKAQKQSLDDEMDAIHGLLNPVRRLSVEILSAILAMSVEPFQEKSPAYRGREYPQYRRSITQLMLVCRYWHNVVIQYHALWKVIPIKLDASTLQVDAFWKTSVQRVKNAPASILLTMGHKQLLSQVITGSRIDTQVLLLRAQQEALRKQVYDSLQVCDLRQIPAIFKLRIESTYSGEITHDLSRMVHFPTGTLETLEINDNAGSEEQLEWWSWTTFLKRFPPFKALTIRGVSGFELDEISQFPTVNCRTLEDHGASAIQDFLLAFPNLEYLHVGPLADQWDHDPPAVAEHSLPNLKYLFMDQSYSLPHGRPPFRTPNLTFFRFTTAEGGGWKTSSAISWRNANLLLQ